MSETKHTTNLEARSYEEPVGHTVWAVRTEWRDEDGRRMTAWPAICDCADLPNEANAKLYAAAPDLLETLQTLNAEVEKYAMAKDVGHEGSSLLEAISDARAAILKATGHE